MKKPPAKSRWRLTEKPKRKQVDKPETVEQRRARVKAWLIANHPDVMRPK